MRLLKQLPIILLGLEVCVPELVLNETRRDWRAIPELAGPGQDYFFQVLLLGKILEKSGKLTRREEASPECRYLVGTWKKMFPNARDGKFPVFFFGKNPVPGKWHSGMQTSNWVNLLRSHYVIVGPIMLTLVLNLKI